MNHPLPSGDVRQATRLLVLDPKDFNAADQQVLAADQPAHRYQSVEEALTNAVPAVRVGGIAQIRVLPRVKPGSAVIHLVNWNYDAARDSVPALRNVRLQIDLAALGAAGATEAKWIRPDAAAITLPIRQDSVTVPELGLWGMVMVQGSRLPSAR